MDASAGARNRRRTATEPDRRSGHRRRTDVRESAQDKIAREAALATLDKFNRGVSLLDDNGAVCFANRAAEAMVTKNDGLLLRRGRLQFSAVDANAVFEIFLANVRDASDSGGLVPRAERSRLKQPYRVLVSRLAHRHKRDGSGAGYCVFVYEPNGGQSLTESAKTSGISVNTARSMLKRIFTKCAVHSQPELLLLLSLGPRTL